MKVHGFAHFSMPWRNCGSEVVIHELLKAAVAAGHEATMWTTHKDATHSWSGREPDITLDGVTIRRVRNALLGTRLMSRYRPDVVVSHHQHVLQAVKTAKLVKARSVFLTHNSYDLNARPMRAKPDLVIHNSSHVAETLNGKFGEPAEWMIFHPPLTPERHLVPSTGESVTLCNLNKDKGAEVFYALAERMPDHSFLGVVGGHGQQIIRHGPNITIHPHGPDMKQVWSRTRVLLMPSEFESYGLVAVEAGLNGIPTIAHPTPGLRENLGTAGTFADRDHIKEWVHRLQEFDNPLTYKEASENARILADDALTATRATLKQWIEWVG